MLYSLKRLPYLYKITFVLFLSCYSCFAFGQNAALVIVDMQPFFSEAGARTPENARKLNELLKRQSDLIDLAKQKGIPILIVEYDGCGDTCEIITKKVGNYPNSKTVIKQRDGLFHKDSGVIDDVKRYLDKHKVTELIVAGANGRFCVKCTIEGAINKGYNVWTDEKAIANFGIEFVHPYRYENGDLILENPEQVKKLNQLSNIKSFDEITNVAKNKSINDNKGFSKTKKDNETFNATINACRKAALNLYLKNYYEN